MVYEKQTWKDLPDRTTPISAARLAHIEDGIASAGAIPTDVQGAADAVNTGRLSAVTLQKNIELASASRGSGSFLGGAPIPVPIGGALLNHSATNFPSIYWPNVINMEGVTGALGKWHMYFSTDHDTGTGGIGMAYADNLLGPWTFNATFKYIDAVDGDQTETPTVIKSRTTGLFHMFYQQEGTGLNQSTFLATSTDGINWTRVGMVISGIPGIPGDGQTTYAKVFQLVDRWYAYHLLGGGNYARTGISYSENGTNWYTDPRRFGTYTDLYGDNTQRLSMSTAQVFRWKGRNWATVKIGPNQSGFVVGGDRWYIIQLSEDLTGIIGSPRRVFESLPAGVTETVVPTSVVEYEGDLYFFYRANGAQGGFRAAIVKG